MKILLIKRGAIGDLLMATPLIRQLKQKLNCQLDILVGKSASIAVSANPYVNNVIAVDDQNFTLKGCKALSRLLWGMRGDYAYVFVLDKHWYFNLLARLVTKKVIGYYRQGDYLSRLILNKSVLYHDVTRYHGHYYLDLLRVSQLAVADYSDIALELLILPQDKQTIDDLIAKRSWQEFIIVTNSGGNNAYEKNGLRMLPRAKILALLQRLLDNGLPVILMGGKLDYANYCDYQHALGNHHNLFNLAGELNLAASCEMLSRAKHFYTTDCGAMHLGVVAGLTTRMTAFFGPSNPSHILPQKYLQSSTLWSDGDIYCQDYQLNGSQRSPESVYFNNLDIKQLKI
jgi:ADP-heptose:LPS heptosyltransferase